MTRETVDRVVAAFENARKRLEGTHGFVAIIDIEGECQIDGCGERPTTAALVYSTEMDAPFAVALCSTHGRIVGRRLYPHAFAARGKA